MTTKLCSNCNLKGKYAKDRCRTCYAYHRRTGRDRPQRLCQRNKLCSNCSQMPAISKGRCQTCYQYYHNHAGRERPSHLWQTNEAKNGQAHTTEQLRPTARQLALATQMMRNVRERIELEQKAPLDLDQACLIYDYCVAFDVLPMAVLDESLNLIDPGKPKAPPLLELLDEEPRFLDEPGRALRCK